MSEPSNFKLIIEDDEGRRSVVPVELGEVSVGRQEGNTIRLNERNVSRRHARFVRDNGHIFAEDLDSYNGVWINGDRIKGRHPVHDGDMIRIGDFQLELRGEGLKRRTEETTQRTIIPEGGSDVTRPNIRLDDTLPGLGAPAGPLTSDAGGASNGAAQAGMSGQSKVDITRFESSSPPVPASARPTIQNPVDDDGPRHEPTAVIRLDQVEEGQRKTGSNAIAGQKAKLICVSTQFAGAEFEIDKTEIVIGRTNENDIAVDHRSVSRHHAKIVVSGRAYRIMDLKSANGTLVNGEEYAQIELKKGDLIELGHVKFRFIPPGETYDFTADEVAAMKASGTTTGRVTIQPEEVDDADVESLDRGRKNDMRPMIVIGASALGVVIIGGIFMWTRGDSARVEEVQPPPSMIGPQAAGASASDMLGRAAAMLAQRQWREAQRHAEAYLVLEPTNSQASAIANKARDEIGAQEALDRAVASIEARQWSEAMRQLSGISETTSAYEEASKYKTQVREAAVRELIDRGSRSIEQRNWQQAIQDMNELERITGPSSDSQRIRAAAAEGEQRGEEMAQAAGREKQARNPQAKLAKTNNGASPVTPPPNPTVVTKPPTPTPTPTPTPNPQTAPPVDAKTYYAQAVAALQQQENDRAIELLEKCVKADPKLGGCYRALGIAHARLRNGPKAARYYRLYLRVMPNAPDAKQVEELLKSYESPAP